MSQTPNVAIAVIGIDIGKNSFHVVDIRFLNGAQDLQVPRPGAFQVAPPLRSPGAGFVVVQVR